MLFDNEKLERLKRNSVQPIPKPDRKKHSRKSIHDFSSEVKWKEYTEAGGVCRICQSEPITQYHHITEKGMGGGRGLGIQINCLGVGDRCHNHDNTEFLKECDRILESRINNLFRQESCNGWVKCIYSLEISSKLKIKVSEIERQILKGFLPTHTQSTYPYSYSTIEDIKRWLKGVA